MLSYSNKLRDPPSRIGHSVVKRCTTTMSVRSIFSKNQVVYMSRSNVGQKLAVAWHPESNLNRSCICGRVYTTEGCRGLCCLAPNCADKGRHILGWKIRRLGPFPGLTPQRFFCNGSQLSLCLVDGYRQLFQPDILVLAPNFPGKGRHVRPLRI